MHRRFGQSMAGLHQVAEQDICTTESVIFIVLKHVKQSQQRNQESMPKTSGRIRQM